MAFSISSKVMAGSCVQQAEQAADRAYGNNPHRSFENNVAHPVPDLHTKNLRYRLRQCCLSFHCIRGLNHGEALN